MKKLLTIILTLVSVSLYAQDMNLSDVSKAAKNKFAAEFPDVKSATWIADNGKYVASWTIYSKQNYMVIDADGKVKKTVTECDFKDFPQTAIDGINQYNSGHYKNFYKMTDEHGVVTFESDYTSGNFTSGVIFDKDGNAITKVARDSETTVKIYNQ